MADLSPEELRSRVASGRIRAISIDTNVFRRSGYKLDLGLLKRISRFADADIDFVLSDVVERELRKHMLHGLSETARKLEESIAKAERLGLIDATAAVNMHGFLASPEKVVDAEIEKFKRDTAAQISFSNNFVEIDALLDSYFGVLPPFEEKSDKKHEFPDAIALLSLEKWADSKALEILVVSEDKGWLSFSSRSNRLHAVKKLADAFDAFSDSVRSAQIFSAVETALMGSDQQTIRDALVERVDSFVSYVDASSYFHVEVELVSVDLAKIDFASIDRRAFRQVEFCEEEGRSKLSLQITIPVELAIEANASFSVYDSIDRDYTTLANDDFSFPHESEIELLLTYLVERHGDQVEVELLETELLSQPEVIEFGELEPDFGPPDDY